MIVNGKALFRANPIIGMSDSKHKYNGASWGMSEAGYDIRLRQDVYFGKQSRFQLASTMEEFDMPDNLVGIVHDKSTHARNGLSVFNTVIEPGWRGFLTLELVYHGNEDDFVIHAGTGIAQVLFHKIEEPATYNGKYQDQPDMPIKAKME